MTSNVKSILLGRHRKYNVARNTIRSLQRQYDTPTLATSSTVSSIQKQAADKLE